MDSSCVFRSTGDQHLLKDEVRAGPSYLEMSLHVGSFIAATSCSDLMIFLPLAMNYHANHEVSSEHREILARKMSLLPHDRERILRESAPTTLEQLPPL